MNILVLNGSPKSDKSITLSYVKHLQFAFPSHTFKILNIAQILPKLKQDADTFNSLISDVQQSSGILWAFPVYICLVPALYKQFIELLWEKDVVHVFKEKYTAALSTSIHIYDHTAHNYIHAVCDDLNMNFCGSYSAEMKDLRNAARRHQLRVFFNNFLDDIKNKKFYPKIFTPLKPPSLIYKPKPALSLLDSKGKKIVVLTDLKEGRNNLRLMIERFSKCFTQPPEIINLWDIDIQGGCLGCMQCGFDFACVYHDKDGYENFYNKKLRQADIIVFAGTVIDRYLSSRWKLFWDRSFFNHHVPSLSKKQFGFIISGPFKQLPNLMQLLDLFTQWQESNCAGYVSDEEDASDIIDAACDSLADSLIRASQQKYFAPKTFLGIGLHKILRDTLFSYLRFPLIQDHVHFLKNRLYDFPHKDYYTRMASTLLIFLSSLPFISRSFKKRMFERTLSSIEKCSNKL